ncbi:MAG TPA: LacI family DNA-binding transcriptional regulator [Streptomyces sp.]|nr:LacI family DNA-binding transcriptional regulator [Streptomyces sp.]
MATMTDVARSTGVSVATVSHRLNGTRPVLPHTRRAVLLSLDARPTAMIIVGNAMSIGTLRSRRDAGLSVPGDTALCCCHDSAQAHAFRPRLTRDRPAQQGGGRGRGTPAARPSRRAGPRAGPSRAQHTAALRLRLHLRPQHVEPLPRAFAHRTACCCPAPSPTARRGLPRDVRREPS